MSKESSSSHENQGEQRPKRSGGERHVPAGHERWPKKIESKCIETSPSPFALALGRRVIKESPDAYPPIEEELHGRLIDNYLQDPDNLPSTEKYLRDIYALAEPEACIQRARTEFSGENLNITPDQAKQLLLMPHLVVAHLTPTPPFAKTIEHLSSVQTIADEHDTTPEAVFERDELYEAFVRKISSPNTVVTRVQETMALIDPTKLRKNLLELEMSRLRIIKGKSAYSLIDKLLDESGTDSPKDIAEIDQQIAYIKKSLLAQGIETITRFWGEEGLAELSEEEQETLGIKEEKEQKSDEPGSHVIVVYKNYRRPKG